MDAVSLPERLLSYALLLLYILLIGKMVRSGLHRHYRSFFQFISVAAAQTVVCVSLLPYPKAYAWAYLLTQPAIWLFYILVVLELYSLVLSKHEGIATLGRWVMMIAVPISIFVSMLSLLADLWRSPGKYPVLVYYTVLERGLVLSLVFFLLMIAGFLLWFPVPVSRNVVLYAMLYAVYFLGSATALFVRNVMGFELTPAVSTSLLALSGVCLLVWVLFLNRNGETQMVVLRHQWHPQDEERLVQQLDSINATLLRTARK